MEARPKTIFCDIDGVIIRHTGDITRQHKLSGHLEILDGVIDCIKAWDKKGYKVF